jgi:tetratricopeptide (TPR) repeat protein
MSFEVTSNNTQAVNQAANELGSLLDQGADILTTIGTVGTAEANYLKAYDNYQKALTAYNNDDFFGRLFTTEPALKKAKEGLAEAESAWQNALTSDQAENISKSSSSVLSYWPLFLMLVVALVVVIVIIKKRK